MFFCYFISGAVLDTIKTNCTKCSVTERNIGKTVITYLMENKVDIWNEIAAKYSPK